jgi:SNF2 family DNA or RNA helicase
MGQKLALKPEQRRAADFLYETDQAMVLAPVGGGKTAITLTAIKEAIHHDGPKRWLVVAPLRVCKDVWPVELKKWAPKLTMAHAFGTAKQRAAAFKQGAQITVTNYENLVTLPEDARFDGIVFDELTRLKNPSCAAHKAAAALIKRSNIQVRWGLTGSFTSEGLADVFGQCKIIDETLLGRTRAAFYGKYFVCVNRTFGQYAPLKGALAAVMQEIRRGVFLLDSEEYYRTLPPLNVVPMPVVLDTYEPYRKMKRDYVAKIGNAEVTALTVGALTTKLQQMASGFSYYTPADEINPKRASAWFSRHKLVALEEILIENQRAPTIVVYNYQEELAALREAYPKARTIDTPGAVEEWNAGKIGLLFIHPKSAGHGLNLQHGGNKMAFMSLPWSQEYYEQTIGRLHRTGQKHAVWVYVLLTMATIDERIFAALKDKRSISDLALEELKNG